MILTPNSKLKMFSKKYLEWVNQANLQPLTRSQVEFAEWLLANPENVGKIMGNAETIFTSIKQFIRK